MESRARPFRDRDVSFVIQIEINYEPPFTSRPIKFLRTRARSINSRLAFLLVSMVWREAVSIFRNAHRRRDFRFLTDMVLHGKVVKHNQALVTINWLNHYVYPPNIHYPPSSSPFAISTLFISDKLYSVDDSPRHISA